LERSNFNDVADLVAALKRVALDVSILAPHKNDLAAMMQRRHWIVHRADHDRDVREPGRPRTRPLDRETVTIWTNTVQKFGAQILAMLEAP
jgi:hypothetical protein